MVKLTSRPAIAAKPRCSVYKLRQKCKCEKRASNIRRWRPQTIILTVLRHFVLNGTSYHRSSWTHRQLTRSRTGWINTGILSWPRLHRPSTSSASKQNSSIWLMAVMSNHCFAMELIRLLTTPRPSLHWRQGHAQPPPKKVGLVGRQ